MKDLKALSDSWPIRYIPTEEPGNRNRVQLTYALELLQTADPNMVASNGGTVIDLLLWASKSDLNIIRESALYGMSGFVYVPIILKRIQEMQVNDPSEEVRQVAEDILGD